MTLLTPKQHATLERFPKRTGAKVCGWIAQDGQGSPVIRLGKDNLLLVQPDGEAVYLLPGPAA